MSTFVCYDPKTGSKKTSPETVQRPQREPCYWVKNRKRQLDGLRSDEAVKERCSFVNTTNDDTIPYAVAKIARQQGSKEKGKIPYT